MFQAGGQETDIALSGSNKMAADGMTIAWSGDGCGNRGKGSAVAGATGRTLAAPDERVLIEHAQAGDREAFEALVHRYDRDVLRIALNILRRPEDARDVYQEAFLKIYKNLSRFRFECSFYTWIYRVVTNVCLDQLRRRNSRPEDQAPEHALRVHDGASKGDFFDRQQERGAASDPERRLMGMEIGRRISTALGRFTARERTALEIKEYSDQKTS